MQLALILFEGTEDVNLLPLLGAGETLSALLEEMQSFAVLTRLEWHRFESLVPEVRDLDGLTLVLLALNRVPLVVGVLQ